MNETFEIRKAERKQSYLRIGLTGPSGSGKTYSALLLARGLASSWNKIVLVDTENKSAELYSHLGSFNVLILEEPFKPERFIGAIQACEASGAEVIILDSASHEWMGKGGCLQIQENLGGRWQDWAKVTPRHMNFIEAILQSSCHIISTTRRKQDYDMNKDSSGKLVVEKVGMKEIQREGFEYELTTNFALDMRHNATVFMGKDRSGLFEGRPDFLITKETGEEYKKWHSEGKQDIDGQKALIKIQLERLGYLGTLKTKADTEKLILKLTKVKLEPKNYEKIIVTLKTKTPVEMKPEPVKVVEKVKEEKK